MNDDDFPVVRLTDKFVNEVSEKYYSEEFYWKGIKMYRCSACRFSTQYKDTIDKHISAHRLSELRETGLFSEDGKPIFTA